MASSKPDSTHFDYYDAGSLSVATYDILEHAVASFAGDIDFYIDLCKGTKTPVLELGTGTGRVAWGLAQAGYQVIGLDLSRGMLDQAVAKRRALAADVGSRCRFIRANMANFNLKQSFDRILIPYRSFGHLTTIEERVGCLGCIRRHMFPEGVGAIHFGMLQEGDLVTDSVALDKIRHVKVRIGESDKLIHWEILNREVDIKNQLLIQQVRFTYRVIDGPILREDVETFRVSWLTDREIHHLLERCGFQIIQESSNFSGAPPRIGADYMVVFKPRAT